MVVALAVGIACREAAPTTAPIAADQVRQASSLGYQHGNVGENGSAGAPRTVVCHDRKAVTESGVFGPSGGTLIFGDSRLVIPGGALRKPVTITAVARGGSSSQVDFEPHGLRFEKPVFLGLGSAGCSIPDGSMPNIVYVDDSGTILETIPARYFPQAKMVAAPIRHFSGYAIAFAR